MGKQGTWEWGRGSSNRGRGTYDVCMHVDGGRVGFGRAPLEIRRRCWRRTAMRDDVRTPLVFKTLRVGPTAHHEVRLHVENEGGPPL